MRHFLANIATYTIISLLAGAAVLFAWMRSAQIVVSDERTVLEALAPGRGDAFEWEALGEISYIRNCRNCHGAEGLGWDEYPPLTHVSRIFRTPGGRDYLIDLHLHGLTSRRWGAPMPTMAHLHDIELAAVLNHVLTHFGNDRELAGGAELYNSRSIQQRRPFPGSPWSVNESRPDVPVPSRQ